MGYTWTVPLAMFGFLPAALLLVAWLKPLRGITAVFVLGWLLLPNAQYKVQMLPAYSKSAAVSLAALACLFAFDSARLATFRPRWIDVFMLLWCVFPSVSSLDNGLGPQDGVAVFLDQVLTWGIPYLFGRLYFGDADAIGVLARGIVLGGILYVPLCAYELRMAPVLHTYIYGFHQHQFLQSIRDGGYRPTVFLQHGLAVGFYMCTSAMICIWLWRRKSALVYLRTPAAWVAVGITVIAVMCKSSGAMAWLVFGLTALWASRTFGTRIPLLVLLVFAPLYMCVRAPAVWTGQELVDFARQFSDDRADSLQGRLISEHFLAAHAMQRPLFGWGGWGRNLVGDDVSNANVVPDGFWVIVFGKYGFAGLFSYTASMLVPVLVVLIGLPKKLLFSPRGSSALALAALVILFVIDSLFNAMLSPIYVLAAGGLAGMGTLSVGNAKRAARRPPVPGRAAPPPAGRRPGAARPVIEVPPAGVRVVADEPAADDASGGTAAP